MKKKSKLPPIPDENRDIKRYIVFKYLRKAIASLLLDAVMIPGVIVSVDGMGLEDNIQVKILLCLVVAALPYPIFGWGKLLRAPHVCGTLVRKGFRYEIESENRMAAGSLPLSMQNANADTTDLKRDVVYFFIKDENGRKFKVRYYDDDEMTPLFFDGDTVCLRRGLKYPYNLTKVHNERYICVVCGKTVPDTADHCPVCGHSIIKIKGHIPRDRSIVEEDTDA